ncbi:hypothetical protein K523DRAFT_358421 [Schizophyllum commune Tattone D]|nr:hypothetical protein K523DRAFT_358421 [Schizophyllum commune Tattone D]
MSVLPGYAVAIFQQAEKLRGKANWHSFAEAFPLLSGTSESFLFMTCLLSL